MKKTGRVAVAFSSGVDSAFLLKAAADTLENEKKQKDVITSFQMSESAIKLQVMR